MTPGICPVRVQRLPGGPGTRRPCHCQRKRPRRGNPPGIPEDPRCFGRTFPPSTGRRNGELREAWSPQGGRILERRGSGPADVCRGRSSEGWREGSGSHGRRETWMSNFDRMRSLRSKITRYGMSGIPVAAREREVGPRQKVRRRRPCGLCHHPYPRRGADVLVVAQMQEGAAGLIPIQFYFAPHIGILRMNVESES
jgi:hypothetical protein